MAVLKTIALVVGAAIALVLIAAAFRPDTFRVQRSVRIAAAPAAIHPWINDVRQMNSWSPYVKKDPHIKGTYRGPAAGPGAAYDFEGNREVGKGSVEITASTPEKITMQLHMREPMEGQNVIEFTLVPLGRTTEVTWSMHGPSPYIGKLVGMIFDMDNMIGRDFEAGLADLKARAEKA